MRAGLKSPLIRPYFIPRFLLNQIQSNPNPNITLKVNEDPKDAMLREYKEEITKLKKMLAAANGGEIPAEPAAGERFRRRERVTRRNERSA